MNAQRHNHHERHHSLDTGWLRAAVLGANDGILSTASLVLGVASAGSSRGAILVSAIAGLVAGAMSMAAGEYVSVYSQADTENADLERERRELENQPEAELDELTAIYVARGVAAPLARQVAAELMAHDALDAHAREEMGLTGATANARPVQAALTSAASFAVGAALPLAVTALVAGSALRLSVAGSSVAFLALLGAISARAGRAPVWAAVWRVTFWGALAMGVTAAIGALVGHAI